MKITNIVTTRVGDKKIEIVLSPEDEQYLLQYAFNELMDKGVATVVKEREDFLLKLEVGGNA